MKSQQSFQTNKSISTAYQRAQFVTGLVPGVNRHGGCLDQQHCQKSGWFALHCERASNMAGSGLVSSNQSTETKRTINDRGNSTSRAAQAKESKHLSFPSRRLCRVACTWRNGKAATTPQSRCLHGESRVRERPATARDGTAQTQR